MRNNFTCNIFLIELELLIRNRWILFIFVFYLFGKVELQSENEIIANETCSKENDFSLRKCFKHLGCFNCGPPFYDPKYRPISVLPRNGSITHFLLYTPQHPQEAYCITFNSNLYYKIFRSSFKRHLRTVILVPGYVPRLKPTNEYFAFKDEILKAGPYNVIVVDWAATNQLSPFYQAIADGRKVAAELAYILKLLRIFKGVRYKNVHLIGHSLGAHVAGWTGKRLNKLGRITALDPAGPYFQNAPPTVRLDKTDALFVDVIHTNDGLKISQGLGLTETLGHQDYFPNGARSQPACENNFGAKVLSHFGIKSNKCDHSLSRKYFIASINRCRFLSVQCENYSLFENGTCTNQYSKIAEMGFWARRIKGIKGLPTFYLYTSSEPPYCFDYNLYNEIAN